MAKPVPWGGQSGKLSGKLKWAHSLRTINLHSFKQYTAYNYLRRRRTSGRTGSCRQPSGATDNFHSPTALTGRTVSLYTAHKHLLLLRPRSRCDEYICVSVCLSTHISWKSQGSPSPFLHTAVTAWGRLVSAALQYVMYFRFYGWRQRHVYF